LAAKGFAGQFRDGGPLFCGRSNKVLKTKEETKEGLPFALVVSPRRHRVKQRRTVPLASMFRYGTTPTSPLSIQVGIDKAGGG